MQLSLRSFRNCTSYGWLTLSCALFATVYAQYYGGGWSNNCLINYCPSFCLPYLPYILQNILATLTFADIGILSRALQSFTTFPAFMSTLQSQSLPLYNAFNSMNSAYGNSFFPFLQSAFSSPSFQSFRQQLSSGGVQPTPILPSNFQPQLVASQLNNLQSQTQQTGGQQQPQPQSQQPQPQPGQTQQPGGGGGAGGGGGFGLGNLLQPVVEETQQIVESTEDEVEGGGEEGQGGQAGGQSNAGAQPQQGGGFPNFDIPIPGQQQQQQQQQPGQQGGQQEGEGAEGESGGGEGFGFGK